MIGWMYQEFPSHLGLEYSSPFKKAAAFTTSFAAERPIATPLPAAYGELATHQNAVLAVEMCIDALEGAVIDCEKRKKKLVLANPVTMSGHYWHDLIDALSGCVPAHHFKCVSLIYEALAYKTNPRVPYDNDF